MAQDNKAFLTVGTYNTDKSGLETSITAKADKTAIAALLGDLLPSGFSIVLANDNYEETLHNLFGGTWSKEEITVVLSGAGLVANGDMILHNQQSAAVNLEIDAEGKLYTSPWSASAYAYYISGLKLDLTDNTQKFYRYTKA